MKKLRYVFTTDADEFNRVQEDAQKLGYAIVHSATMVFQVEGLALCYGVLVTALPDLPAAHETPKEAAP